MKECTPPPPVSTLSRPLFLFHPYLCPPTYVPPTCAPTCVPLPVSPLPMSPHLCPPTYVPYLCPLPMSPTCVPLPVPPYLCPYLCPLPVPRPMSHHLCVPTTPPLKTVPQPLPERLFHCILASIHRYTSFSQVRLPCRTRFDDSSLSRTVQTLSDPPPTLTSSASLSPSPPFLRIRLFEEGWW